LKKGEKLHMIRVLFFNFSIMGHGEHRKDDSKNKKKPGGKFGKGRKDKK
jgi:hypothetical protein